MRAFSSAQDLLIEENIPSPSCLVVDYYMPGMNGLELVARLRERKKVHPSVLITSPDENLRNQAAAFGVTMLDKPMLGGPLLKAEPGALLPQSSVAESFPRYDDVVSPSKAACTELCGPRRNASPSSTRSRAFLHR